MSAAMRKASHRNGGKPPAPPWVVICPQCRARYTPHRATRHRRVRCSHCGHVWRDEGDAAGTVADALDSAAAAWSHVGSTVLAAADHASTIAHRVREVAAPAPPAASEWIGRTFGRYKIKAVLGQGAMGYVYEAVDQSLKRTVALKVLPQRIDPQRKPVGLKMFLQEARVAARLQHPNAVVIYEVGQADGIYFFAMERVHGVTLMKLVGESGPLQAAQACYVIAHAARALAAGHAIGVVHRDVKPGNIMIDTAGRVKVTDFGLADVAGIEGIGELSERPLGTPGWISPEVARGERATAASDIYGLGLTLHFVMTGERLIPLRPPDEMIRAQREARSIRREQLPQSWPERLRDITVQCLQADPADRYQSAEVFATELLRVLAPDTSDATVTLSGPRAGAREHVSPVWTWLVLGLLVLVAGFLAIWWWWLR